MGKYYLAIYWGSEGWDLQEMDSLNEVIKAIKEGDTYGNKFKVLHEIPIKIKK